MKQDERDMLVKVCAVVDEIKHNNDKMDEKLDKHIEKDSTFLTKKMWMWMTGILIVFVMGAYSFTFNLGGEWHDHATDFAIHLPHIVDGR